MSPEQSIKNSCCETNIWRRRTGFYFIEIEVAENGHHQVRAGGPG
jgi:hypothetical protein